MKEKKTHHNYNRNWTKAQNRRTGWRPKPKGGPRRLTDQQQAERRVQIATAYPGTKKAKAKAASAKRQFARYNGEHKAPKKHKAPRYKHVQPQQGYGGTADGYVSRAPRVHGWDNGDW